MVMMRVCGWNRRQLHHFLTDSLSPLYHNVSYANNAQRRVCRTYFSRWIRQASSYWDWGWSINLAQVPRNLNVYSSKAGRAFKDVAIAFLSLSPPSNHAFKFGSCNPCWALIQALFAILKWFLLISLTQSGASSRERWYLWLYKIELFWNSLQAWKPHVMSSSGIGESMQTRKQIDLFNALLKAIDFVLIYIVWSLCGCITG